MMRRAGELYYLHADQLGSIIAITNSSGELVEQYAYSAFGEMKIFNRIGTEIQESSIGNIFGFTGREFDVESDLYYYRARFYSPEIGRFISSDPHAGKVKQPSSVINKYIYGVNNPIEFLDPDGKFAISLSAFLLGGALYTFGTVLGQVASNLYNKKGAFDGITVGSIATNFVAGMFYYGLYGFTTPVGMLGSFFIGLAVNATLSYAVDNDIIRKEDRDEHEFLINGTIILTNPTPSNDSSERGCFFGDNFSSCDAFINKGLM